MSAPGDPHPQALLAELALEELLEELVLADEPDEVELLEELDSVEPEEAGEELLEEPRLSVR